MRYTRKFLTLIFAIVLLIGLTAITASAQRRGNGRVVYQPVVVRHYIRHDPFWYGTLWGNPYFYDPYYNERQQRNYLRSRVEGNRRELRKHLEKYNADGVLTAKERAELEDDYRDVENAEDDLDDYVSDD